MSGRDYQTQDKKRDVEQGSKTHFPAMDIVIVQISKNAYNQNRENWVPGLSYKKARVSITFHVE